MDPDLAAPLTPVAGRMILGLDVGGTKSAALLITPSGDLHRRIQAPTPSAGDAETLFAFLDDLARKVLTDAKIDNSAVAGIGVSAGAPADARRGIVYAAPNLPGWGVDGFPLAERLSHTLGLPVRVENDADATALAEHRFGAGAGANFLAFLTVGTGIGAGLILDGRLHRGRDGAGGEIGHIAAIPGGRLCPCGLQGCLEAYASGPGIVKSALENGYTGPASGAAVADAARAGDLAAKDAFTTAARLLGTALASLTMLLNLERIVLGTMAVHAADLLLDEVRRSFAASAWPRLSDGVQIVPAMLGDRAQDLAALCAWLGPGAAPGAGER